jgi:WD40 repeat protein
MRNIVKVVALIAVVELIILIQRQPVEAVNNTLTPTPSKSIQFEEVNLPFLKHAFSLSWFRWNPTNYQVAVAYNENVDVSIFDASSNQLLFKLIKPSPSRTSESVSQLSWSPNGHLLAVGFQDEAIFVWDMTASSPRIISTIHETGPIMPINWSPNSQRLVFSFSDGPDEPQLSIWSLISNQVVETLPRGDRVFLWSPNGKEIALLKSGQDGEVIDSRTRAVAFGLPRSSKDGWILNQIAMSWSPDSQRLIGIDCNGTSSECIVWFRNLADSTLLLASNSETTTLGADQLVWRSTGDLVATNSGQNLLNIWNPKTGTLLATIDSYDERVASLDWSCDGQTLVTITQSGVPRIWKITKVAEF